MHTISSNAHSFLKTNSLLIWAILYMFIYIYIYMFVIIMIKIKHLINKGIPYVLPLFNVYLSLNINSWVNIQLLV